MFYQEMHNPCHLPCCIFVEVFADLLSSVSLNLPHLKLVAGKCKENTWLLAGFLFLYISRAADFFTFYNAEVYVRTFTEIKQKPLRLFKLYKFTNIRFGLHVFLFVSRVFFNLKLECAKVFHKSSLKICLEYTYIRSPKKAIVIIGGRKW